MAERDDLDLLAGEYVLGVLPPEERVAVERRLLDSPELARLVAAWEQRLTPLSEDLAPLTPRPQVWQQIRSAVGATQRAPRPPWWERAGIWRGWAIGASIAALGLLVMVALPPTPSAHLVAVLNDSGGRPLWVVRAAAEEHQLMARPLAEGGTAAQVPELWLLPRDGSAPVSLGLLESDSSNLRALPEPARALLEAGATLAVSLEPVGGSPIGQPTGPVVSTGLLVEEPS